MRRRLSLLVAITMAAAFLPVGAYAGPSDATAGKTAAAGRQGGQRPTFAPGAPGIGDPYFPLDGNGGYDVAHYGLTIDYRPATDVLTGTARITARATKNLSRFDLDLEGLTVSSITVNGRPAHWSRSGQELKITPQRQLRRGHRFTAVVRYRGVPKAQSEFGGVSGFVATDDGAVVAGQPHVAATWYPVNDHPADKASYTFRVTVPKGLQVLANGVLQSQRTRGAHATWTWVAKEPMASYLATATIGRFDLHSYQRRGISYVDAIDPDLLRRTVPRTGSQYALSQSASSAYQRLTHTIAVPTGGGSVSFWLDRQTEEPWDFALVEAHTVGRDDWTTLRDANGHTSQSTGASCPGWLELHPFLRHYQTAAADEESCTPSGTSGAWWAATGSSNGYERWTVDLGRYAGTTIELSITAVTDESFARPGLFVDDVVVSTGQGTTSFEKDADPSDGWRVSGPPAGSPGNAADWKIGTSRDAPATIGEIVEQSFRRQPEIIDFLSARFGPYPFSAAGGLVDDLDGLGFALENQTRPIYSKDFFSDPDAGADVIVHELTHQWYGDSLAVRRWQHIWLNEGFATYAQWLWSENEGNGTAQEIFDSLATIPADSPFWRLKIGDPGADHLFDGPVYSRGGMTLHALRLKVGDRAFFTILRRWAQSRRGGTVTTPQFIRLAQRVSGQDLHAFFQTWLFTATKPGGLPEPAAATSRRSSSTPKPTPPSVARALKQAGAGATRPRR